MGDGQVALILDVLGFAHHAGVASEARESAQTSGQAEVRAKGEAHQSLLIAKNGSDGQVAIPLSVVARLEGFAAALVKHVGNREVMDYRGQIIPLVRLSAVLPAGNVVTGQSVDASSIEVVISRNVDILPDSSLTALWTSSTSNPKSIRSPLVRASWGRLPARTPSPNYWICRL